MQSSSYLLILDDLNSRLMDKLNGINLSEETKKLKECTQMLKQLKVPEPLLSSEPDSKLTSLVEDVMATVRMIQ